MIIQYLRRISDRKRSAWANRHLGYSLAFIAGAVNAGGFLAIGQYTSHMSGIVSSAADHLALAEFSPALTAFAAFSAFISGAAISAILVNFARRRQLRSEFALSLLFEAILLLMFGVAGVYLDEMRDFWAPVTVLLLCFIMGLQNATITKVSSATIRTTHMTGVVTDIGIELGKLIYYNRRHIPGLSVHANREKVTLHAALLASFFVGGICGALGFKRMGYTSTIPLAAGLIFLALGPILTDIKLLPKRFRQK